MRNRLIPLLNAEVVVCLRDRVGRTESTLIDVGIDYLELKCRAEANTLIIPFESISTIIKKS